MKSFSATEQQRLRGLGRIGVLYGGISAEREVSLQSGQAVYDALIELGLDAQLFDVDADCVTRLLARPFDFAFIVLHGTGGEDGKIQAVLDWLNIPYTGSGVLASALAMDKVKTKQIWHSEGLPIIESQLLSVDFSPEAVVRALGLPLAIKPALEGSSIGVSKVSEVGQLKAAYGKAQQSHLPNGSDACSGIYHDSETAVMAERWIEGTELTAAVVAGEVLPLIRIRVEAGFYDYQTKYVTGALAYDCPSGLPTEQESAIQQIIKCAVDAAGIRDWARVDGILDNDGQFWLLEINTIPGMTQTSLVPKAARQAGYTFPQVVGRILLSAEAFYHA